MKFPTNSLEQPDFHEQYFLCRQKKIVETSRLFKWENLTIFFIVCKKNNLVSSFSFTWLFVKYSVKYLVRLIYF